MADDTGIFIDALGGKPGVQSARWAGETATTAEIMNHCLERLKGIKNRTATFRTTVAVISPEGKEYFFTGEVQGKLLKTPRVEFQPQMPYSSLFVPEGGTKSWAEMTIEDENKVSHRGKAFGKVKEFLKKEIIDK